MEKKVKVSAKNVAVMAVILLAGIVFMSVSDIILHLFMRITFDVELGNTFPILYIMYAIATIYSYIVFTKTRKIKEI